MATQTENAINWALKQVGSYNWKGKCQGFVADCFYRGAGMPRMSKGSALIACSAWRVSTSRTGIPTGAAVYFDSPTSPQYGHVGLCIGNDQIVHAFGKIKVMSISAVISSGYKYKGWGWNGGVKPTGAGNGTISYDSSSSSSSSATTASAPEVIHVPQVEKLFTVYEDDPKEKEPDAYKVVWQPYGKEAKNITDKVSVPSLVDDSDSVCAELSFNVLATSTDKYFPRTDMACGDMVSVVNTSTNQIVFTGMIENLSGDYTSGLSVRCLDKGRLLTTNEIIMQFNNIAAKVAISNVGQRIGFKYISCPNLISSVYKTEKKDGASIIQDILDVVTSENGIPYFVRVMGDTLVVKSFGKEPITPRFRQADNVRSFKVLDEAETPSFTRSIEGLQNQIKIYSEADSSVSVLATAKNDASIKRYGLRQGLEAYDDSVKVSASSKANTLLKNRNVVQEEISLTTYGSDAVTAGCMLYLDYPEAKGNYWVKSVTHELGKTHRMSMNLIKVVS